MRARLLGDAAAAGLRVGEFLSDPAANLDSTARHGAHGVACTSPQRPRSRTRSTPIVTPVGVSSRPAITVIVRSITSRSLLSLSTPNYAVVSIRPA